MKHFQKIYSEQPCSKKTHDLKVKTLLLILNSDHEQENWIEKNEDLFKDIIFKTE
jgi:hypothetical protein